LAALALPAAAGEIHKVPQDHPTIQAAVDAAADGDTIQISTGTYDEAVVVTGKTNLLIEGKGKAVIAPTSGIGLKLDSCTTCTVEKLTFQGGNPNALQLLNSTGCTLSKLTVEDATSDGLRADGGSGHTIDKCTVTGGGGAGIALGADTAVAVDGCTVSKCKV